MKKMLTVTKADFDTMETDLTAWNTFNLKEADRSLADARSTHATSRTIMIALLGIPRAAAAGLAFVIALLDHERCPTDAAGRRGHRRGRPRPGRATTAATRSATPPGPSSG